MKINSFTIENIKSFKNSTIIPLDTGFNLLVGPNGGGKSNFLDILTIVLREFFLRAYEIRDYNEGTRLRHEIVQSTIFQPIHQYLEKYVENESQDSKIEIEFIIEKSDIDKINYLKRNKSLINAELIKLRSQPINANQLDSWDSSKLTSGQIVKYTILNNALSSNLTDGSAEFTYMLFLNFYEMFILLFRDKPDIKLNPLYLYFPPNRGVVSFQNLQANLSSSNFSSLLIDSSRFTSKGAGSLLILATHYFSEKRRNIEAVGGNIEKLFYSDKEVRVISKYLKKLGYTWKLECIDKLKNVYEILLEKEKRTFFISQASSGEKEILNFLFGIFSLNIQEGIIVIDEPEVHLHPKWQFILISLLIELSKKTKTQFIVSTHSGVFVTEDTLSSVVRIYRNEGISDVHSLKDARLTNLKDLLHIVNSHNNEKTFFADKVVLVEGIKDRIFIERLISFYASEFQVKDVIEVLEVHGKNNLQKYRDFLNEIKVSNYIIADNDYLLDIGDTKIKPLFITDSKKIKNDVINSKKSNDREILIEKLEAAISKGDISKLKEFWEYLRGRLVKLKEKLTKEEERMLNEFIANKRKEHTYILSKGEIENYLPDNQTTLENAIELIKIENFIPWLAASKSNDKKIELDEIIFKILNVKFTRRDRLLNKLKTK